MNDPGYLSSARQWWKNASPSTRRVAATIAIPIILYVISFLAPSGMFIDARHGVVTNTTIVLPVFILAAIFLALTIWGSRWRNLSTHAQAGIGVGAFLLAAYCTRAIASGLVLCLHVSSILFVVEGALLLLMFSLNARYIRTLWAHGLRKERAFSGVAATILLCYFFILTVPDLASHLGLVPHVSHATTPALPSRSEAKEQNAKKAAAPYSEPRPVDVPANDANGVPYPPILSAANDSPSNLKFASAITPEDIDAIDAPKGNILWGRTGERRAYSCKTAGVSEHAITELYYFSNLMLRKSDVWVDRESCIVSVNIVHAGSTQLTTGNTVVFSRLADGNCYKTACATDVEVSLNYSDYSATTETYAQYYGAKVESGARTIILRMCKTNGVNTLWPCDYSEMRVRESNVTH
jgi:hypothetical protein